MRRGGVSVILRSAQLTSLKDGECWEDDKGTRPGEKWWCSPGTDVTGPWATALGCGLYDACAVFAPCAYVHGAIDCIQNAVFKTTLHAPERIMISDRALVLKRKH